MLVGFASFGRRRDGDPDCVSGDLVGGGVGDFGKGVDVAGWQLRVRLDWPLDVFSEQDDYSTKQQD